MQPEMIETTIKISDTIGCASVTKVPMALAPCRITTASVLLA